MTKRFQIATILVMVLVTIGTIAILIFNPNTTNNLINTPPPSNGSEVTLDNGLKYQILKDGTGDDLKAGQTASVHYVGTLLDGTKFDSSRDRGTPFDVVNVGSAGVIDGWNQGLIGMKTGELRKLTIPPELGYGSQANGSIPANSTLVFEIELLEIK